ncbi:MAG: GTP pyrophosphokinase family protein [Dysgonamonadaceae bacterium]|jgi:putative GTP pyrophosphokinase|nr:GTP pyrophosphokinase family protein [Dysgonamonadaceae bacterium]
MKDFIDRHIQKLEDAFVKLFQKSLEPGQKLMSYYRCALMAVETKFNILNEEFSLVHERNPIETIKTRIKTPDSIRKKLRKKGLPLTIDLIEKNINDVAGIRVICPFIDDIYVLTDCLVNQDDVTLFEKKDYIARPKENGYRSLHLIIAVPIYLHNEKKLMKAEVQLRTIAMDFWANLEHRLRYKKDINDETAKKIAAELNECAETSAMLDSKMRQIRDNIETNV